GQAPAAVDFQAHLPRGTVLLNAGRAEFVGRGVGFALQFDYVDAHWQGQGELKMPGVLHYINRATDVPIYERVRYQNIYPGIDIIYYMRGGHLEYDLELAPHADARLLRFHIEAAHSHLDAEGNLSLEGGFVLHRPAIYQEISGRRRSIGGRYRLRGNQ